MKPRALNAGQLALLASVRDAEFLGGKYKPADPRQYRMLSVLRFRGYAEEHGRDDRDLRYTLTEAGRAATEIKT